MPYLVCMKRISLLLFLCSTFFATAQDIKIIFLKENTKQTTLFEEELISERSAARRKRLNIAHSEFDLPVNHDIIAAMTADGEVMNVSRWLNALTFKSPLTSDELLLKYDFIDRIQVVKSSGKSAIIKDVGETKSLNYGLATVQIEQINLNCLHDMGFTGENVLLCVIDAGFRKMDSLNYFSNVYLEGRVLDTYNFLDSAQTVYDYSGHGSAVASCIVAENSTPDQYIGAAVDVDLALYVSEDVSSETEIEEFNLVAALERADSIGVDVVNISLGYFAFDDSTTSHVYSDLDGQTTIAAIGVNIAKSMGIFVVNSAGNSGPSNISTPCDAPGTFCVGAVAGLGEYAWFSSVGPSADGRVKPDVMARGGEAWIVNGADSLQAANGTSFASPIISGGVACLIQAHPTKSVDELMDAIRASASLFTNPNDSMGYGIPDFCLANAILNGNVGVSYLESVELSVHPNPTSGIVTISGLTGINEFVHVSLYDNLGRLVLNETHVATNAELNLNVSALSHGVYQLIVRDGDEIQRSAVCVAR